MDYTKLKLNENNPRTISEVKYKKLLKSIESFTKMLGVRPIAYDESGVIWGGNMRYRALLQLHKDGKVELKPEYFKELKGFTEEEKREFAIRDNVELGDWDMDILANEWSDLPLDGWGVPVPKETERLSDLKFSNMYYTPREVPNINLALCVNLEKFNAKLAAIENADLTQEQKDILKYFAYRFIKIDFENVANYYYFNATEEEKKVMERLRLVLCDGGVEGFIEDHLLKVYSILEDWSDD